MRLGLTLVLVLAVGIVMGALGHQALNAQPAASPIAVQSKGQHATIKYESVIAGHLTDVNGKYKLRITNVRFDPGAGLANISIAKVVHALSRGEQMVFVGAGHVPYVSHPNDYLKTVLNFTAKAAAG